MKCISPRGWVVALAAIGLALTAQPAKAAFTVISGDRRAEADFSLSGTTLTLTLTNTSLVAVTSNGNVLQSVVWDYSGPGGISDAVSANLKIGSTVLNWAGSPTSQMDVSGEWAFKVNGTFASGSSPTFNYGVSAAGLNGAFGAGDAIGNTRPSPETPGTPPDGGDWGIVSSPTPAGEPNANEVVIKDSVVFTFTVNSDFNIGAINSVQFVWGTSGTDRGDGGGGGGNVVPAPAGLILLATAFPVLALRRVIRRKQAAA